MRFRGLSKSRLQNKHSYSSTYSPDILTMILHEFLKFSGNVENLYANSHIICEIQHGREIQQGVLKGYMFLPYWSSHIYQSTQFDELRWCLCVSVCEHKRSLTFKTLPISRNFRFKHESNRNVTALFATENSLEFYTRINTGDQKFHDVGPKLKFFFWKLYAKEVDCGPGSD